MSRAYVGDRLAGPLDADKYNFRSVRSVDGKAPRTRRDYGARVRIWDNGGETCDRYTILPPARAGRGQKHRGEWACIAASERPYHPQGFGQHVTAMPGSHLGKRIHWNDLPPDVQRFVRQEWPEWCPEVVK